MSTQPTTLMASVATCSPNYLYNMHHGNNSHIQPEYGHDIPPDEERIPIQMIIGSHENDQGEMEVEYEQVYVARPRFGIFYEPQDETPAAPRNAEQSRGNIYYREEKRLQTFSGQWLDQYPVEPEDLARNGFVYMGPGDKVKCVFCLKTLRGWEPGDTVEREHQRHYPDCPFVLGQCHNLNVPLTMSRNASYGVKLKEEVKPQIKQADMQDVTNRLESFRMAPPTISSIRDKLVDAGFFYTGNNDVVKCYACGQEKGEWMSQDEPLLVHARLCPDCPFIKKTLAPKLSQVASANTFQYQASASNHYRHPQSMAEQSQGLYKAQSTPVQQAAGADQTAQSYPPQQQFKPSQQVSRNGPQLSVPVQVSTAQIESDLKSPAVQAMREIDEDISVEEIRTLLESIRLEKGPDYHIKLKDLEQLLDKPKHL